MAPAFLELADRCAPAVQVELLAGVISLESRFNPLNIRINGGRPLASQPTSKAEAIELATTLIAEHQNVQIGLGGIGTGELQKLGISVSNAFDPCLNLKATAFLLDGYYRLAVRAGAGAEQAEKVMLQSYYGRNDPSIGAMIKYDARVRREARHLRASLSFLVVTTIGDQDTDADSKPGDRALSSPPRQISPTVDSAFWDVFGFGQRSAVLVFPSN